MNLKFRLAELDDLPRLARLNAMGIPSEEEKALRELPAFIYPGHVVCATIEGVIIGLLYWKDLFPQEWELTQITIEEGWRRRGIGSELIREFFRLARKVGVRKITGDIRPENRASRALIGELDGKEVGTENFGEMEDRILFEFDLWG